MDDDKASSFLQHIRQAQRGKLKVYLGYAAGVGKTYQMLLESHRLKQEGIDLAVGLVETHGRAEIDKLLEGLEVIPRRKIQYHGITIEEMDLEAVLLRHPQVALVDEIAHTNVPGSKNTKRHEDVYDLLAAGIHVISTLNVQHLESLHYMVKEFAGVDIHERLPDFVLAEAEEVVNIDLAPEDLQQRLRDGKIYPAERINSALESFFKRSNLDKLRELALRELASQIDIKRRITPEEEQDITHDQVMVCLSSRGPNRANLLRYGSRLAGRLNRYWYAVYVQTPREVPAMIDDATRRLIADSLSLARLLGAQVLPFKGEDVVDTILRFAKEYRVGHIVIGRPQPLPFWRRWLGQKTVAERLINEARGLTIVVVDTGADNQNRL